MLTERAQQKSCCNETLIIFTDERSLTEPHFTTKSKKEKSVWGSKFHWRNISALASQLSSLTTATNSTPPQLGTHRSTRKEIKAGEKSLQPTTAPSDVEFNT